jgi:hypothetical protein
MKNGTVAPAASASGLSSAVAVEGRAGHGRGHAAVVHGGVNAAIWLSEQPVRRAARSAMWSAIHRSAAMKSITGAGKGTSGINWQPTETKSQAAARAAAP